MDRMLQFFALDNDSDDVLMSVHNLAHQITAECPLNPERTVALRKLLEAKDALIRTREYKDEK